MPQNNVLVSEDGTPMITDFGNAILEQGTMQFTETVKQNGFTPRWTAPEILDEREVRQSKEADVYALGMTVLEVITGRVPYSHINNTVTLIKAVAIKHEIPKRPEDIPSDSKHGDALWSLLQRCWKYKIESRPKADQVAETMKGITRSGLVPGNAAPGTLPKSNILKSGVDTLLAGIRSASKSRK
ncbi:hypothetical protein FRC12_010509 [Ceratobasidium sp. 428]|nr:hypothetical protein FRC12_010509 [Ceratobasidium sp. 428]